MAKSTRSLYEKKLAKENQRLLKNLKRRFNNLINKFGYTHATEKAGYTHVTQNPRFKVLNVPMSTRGLTKEQLKKQHRDLVYLSGLRTSTVVGQKNYEKFYNTILNVTNQSADIQVEFWKIYEHWVEERGLDENYKYDVMEIIQEGLASGDSEETIMQRISDLYYSEPQAVSAEDWANIFSM